MKPDVPQTTNQSPIQDVVAPIANASAEVQIAEPPKELQFTEVTPDISSVPTPMPTEPAIEPKVDLSQPEQPKETPKVETPAPKPKVKDTPTPKDGPRKPIGTILVAVIVFVALASAAYYAYTRSS